MYIRYAWIASSTIDDHLLLTSRLTALYFGFQFPKSSSSCRLGLNSTLFVSLSHYYNLEDTLSSGLLHKNPTQLFDQLLLFPSFNINRCDTPWVATGISWSKLISSLPFLVDKSAQILCLAS